MTTAILLSGGTGQRTGFNIPKQYMENEGRMLISYSLEALIKSAVINAVVIVCADEWQDSILDCIKNLEMSDDKKTKVLFTYPGGNRQQSIYNGLLKCSEELPETDYVFIHDAARPYLTEEMITTYIDTASKHDGCMPVLPMKDTVYYSEDGHVVSKLLSREKIFAGQAPEVFSFDKYLKANEALLPDAIKSINGSTEPAIKYGMDIAMVRGEEKNYKITTKADYERFISDNKIVN